jgi:mRNA interferase HicA
LKRTELLDRISEAARERGIAFEFVREGGNHEIWALAGRPIQIPRHRELREPLAWKVLRSTQRELGTRWWRR